MVPLSKASVFSLQQILCGRAHSNLCWRRTTIFPGSSCARCPEFLCSHTGKAVPPHFHLRDRFDRWDHHYRGRQTNRRKSRSDRQARELLAPPRQLQGLIIDPNLLTEPEIRSPGTSGHQRCPTGPVVGHPTAQCFLHPPMLTDLPNPAQPLLHEQQSPALSGHTSERTSPITFPAPPAPFAFLTIPSELQPSEPCSFQHFCSACALFCPSLLPKSQHCINFLVTAGAHTLLPHSCDLLPLNPPRCQARVSALHSHHSTLNQSLWALPARFSS